MIAHPLEPIDPSGWQSVRLRRDGMKPLCFAGRLVGRHDGWMPRTILWHELALYRQAPTGYAIEIVARLAAGPDREKSEPTRCHAGLFESLDAALTGLETHDAARDVCPGIGVASPAVSDPTLPPAMLLIQAGLLQAFCRDVVQRYGAGVSSFLYSICIDGI